MIHTFSNVLDGVGLHIHARGWGKYLWHFSISYCAFAISIHFPYFRTNWSGNMSYISYDHETNKKFFFSLVYCIFDAILENVKNISSCGKNIAELYWNLFHFWEKNCLLLYSNIHKQHSSFLKWEIFSELCYIFLQSGGLSCIYAIVWRKLFSFSWNQSVAVERYRYILGKVVDIINFLLHFSYFCKVKLKIFNKLLQ